MKLGVLLALGGVAASPVTKVVELIKELKAKIEDDEVAEQKLYDKYACWCEKTTDRKAGAIEQGKKDVARLGNQVLSLKGKVATLASEIAGLVKDIKENEDAQAKNTRIRQDQNADFQQEKAEMEQTLNALQRAIVVLSGAGTKEALLSVRSTIEAALTTVPVPAETKNVVKAFLQSGYSPQSETIQGILKDMYSTFATNLESDTQEELDRQTRFQDKMTLLQEENAAFNEQLSKKRTEKADKEQQLADATQTLTDTTEQMNDDAEFFENTVSQCKTKADEYNERARLRKEELDGIAKALEVLTSDEARATFGAAIKPGFESSSFIQKESRNNGVSQAVRAIQKTATKTHSLRLASLAAQMKKAGHFDVVIKAINTMISDLGDEEQDDKDKRDTCKDETHKKSERKAVLVHKIERNVARIAKLNSKLDKVNENIALTAEAIQQTKDDITDMTNARNEEHEEHLKAKSDDESAVALLKEAIGHLSSYYDANEIDQGKLQENKFLQEPEFEVSEDQAPDAEFGGKGSHKGESKGIVSILTMLKQDLESEIKNGVAAEVESRTAYEKNKATAEKLLESLETKKTNLESEKVLTEENIESTETDKAENEGLRDDKQGELDAIKPGCDWILANFEKRRDFRRAESEGLAQAKAILSGAQAGLIAKKSHMSKTQVFDDAALGKLEFRGLSFLQKKQE